MEIHGTVGASITVNRKSFSDGISEHSNITNIKIIHSQSGYFTRSKGKEVMENFIKAKQIHRLRLQFGNDMAIGAIQAIKEAGLKPGSQIKVISINGVLDIFKVMTNGKVNATHVGRIDAQYGLFGI